MQFFTYNFFKTYYYYFFSFKQSGEASRWRVCYQRNLPRLVSSHPTFRTLPATHIVPSPSSQGILYPVSTEIQLSAASILMYSIVLYCTAQICCIILHCILLYLIYYTVLHTAMYCIALNCNIKLHRILQHYSVCTVLPSYHYNILALQCRYSRADSVNFVHCF